MVTPLVSIVVPMCNEGHNVQPLLQALQQLALQQQGFRFEVICVNDGSHDDTLGQLQQAATGWPALKVVDLSRRFGKEIALTAGMMFAQGHAAICMDGDLQHPVELIPLMLAKWQAGAETVVGIRQMQAKGLKWRAWANWCFYGLMGWMLGTRYTPGETDFCLLDRKVIVALNSIGERQRFFRGLIAWLGFRRETLVFVPGQRRAGQPAYTPHRLRRLALTAMLSASSWPLMTVGLLGAGIVGCASLLLLWMQLAQNWISAEYYYTPLAKFVVFNTWLMGWVLMALGLIALYVGKLYGEMLHRPLFAIRELINIQDSPQRLGGGWSGGGGSESFGLGWPQGPSLKPPVKGD